MKEIKGILPFLLFGFIMACCIQACKTTQLIQAKPIIHTVYSPLLINNYIHDSVKVKAKQLTPDQFQIFLNDQYKINFDKFIAPEFNRLGAVIATQAKSIDILSSTIASVRERSIRTRDSMQYQNKELQKDVLNYKKSNDLRNEADAARDSGQIKWMNTIIKYMLVGIAIIVIAYIVMFAIGMLIWKKIKHIEKQLQNV